MDSFKVALISEEFPPFSFGGIASACHDLSLALSKKGIFTTVFCGKAEKMTVERVNDKLEIVRLPCLDFPPRFLWFQLQNVKLLSRLLQDYAVLHVVNPQVGATVAYLGRKLKKPIVTSIHGVHLFSLKLAVGSPFSYWTAGDVGYQFSGYPLQRYFDDVCLKNSDSVTVCSFSTLAELKSIYHDLDFNKFSVIHNGINFNEIDSTSKNKEKSSSIVFYGRLYWTKGVSYLLSAVADLQQDFPDVGVQIFGDGPLKRKIVGLVSDLGLTEKVSIRGFVSHERLMSEVGKASIVVFPSLYEAQPISILEAMACKKPVVAFDLPFSREIIRDGYDGVLAKTGDVEDLTRKIRLLLGDEKLRLRLGNNAYEQVKKEHNWDTLVERYLEIYRNVAGI